MNRIKLRSVRPRHKALFGESVAAAGITAAATLAAAGMQVKATKDAAKTQAQQVKSAAEKQATAIQQQSDNNKDSTEKMLDTYKEQMAEQRAAYNDYQLALQQAMGLQNQNDRLSQGLIQVRNGGIPKRTKDTRTLANPFYRGTSIPFMVTDGGTVVPVAQTPDGMQLYEVLGNDHKHYHKAQGGKNKTGVGIKFADGTVVEGEGNQNSNQGEYLLMPNTRQSLSGVSPMFLSKHSIEGFNPVQAVNAGMNPLQAFVLQEQIKDANGISDDGKNDNRPPVERIACLGGVFRRALANGGRTKAALGIDYSHAYGQTLPDENQGYYNGVGVFNGGQYLGTLTNINPDDYRLQFKKGGRPKFANAGSTTKSKSSWWSTPGASQIVGAGINSLGGLGASWLTVLGNNSARRTLANAYNEAGDILANAYSNMTGIDTDYLNESDFRAAHMLPALSAVMSRDSAPLAQEERARERTLYNAGRYSLSGASANNRMNLAEINSRDARSRIYSADEEQMQNTRAQNVQSINQAAQFNAQADNQARQARSQYLTDILKYNNDINNTKILGSAQARADALTQSGSITAQTAASNGQAWAGAINNIGSSFGNAFGAMGKQQADMTSAILGADTSSQITALTSGLYNNKQLAQSLYNQYRNDPAYKDRMTALANYYGLK